MTEITSEENAKERIKKIFGDIKDIDSYAKIAYFLSQDKEVVTGLNNVSADLWDVYLAQNGYSRSGDKAYARTQNAPEQKGNRFTRAILEYAINFGFSCQKNVVFTGPLTSNDFLKYVKDGILWKDTFAPEHGEFSHSFQWLAAGREISALAKQDIARLYKGSADIMNIVDVHSRVEGNWTVLTKGKVPLWAWLVDCFPAKTVRSTTKIDPLLNIASDSCRTPNNITKKVQGLGNNSFIAHYVSYRQNVKLHNANESGKSADVLEMRDGKEVKKPIQYIKSHQTNMYEKKSQNDKTGWKAIGSSEKVCTVAKPDESKEVHRAFERQTSDSKYTGKIVGAWTMKQVEFHGKKGYVPGHIFQFDLAK